MNARLTLLAIAMVCGVAAAHDITREAADERRRQVELTALAQADAKAAKLPIEQTAVLTLKWGEEVGALVRVTNADDGKAIPLSGEIHRALNWYSIAHGAQLRLPRRKLRLEMVRGLETELTTADVDLTDGKDREIQLAVNYFGETRDSGARSGNTHLHLKDLSFTEMDRYLRLVPKTDELDIVFVSHLERKPEDKHYISNTLTAGDLGRLSESGTLFGNGEEHRHNFGPGDEGYGHVMFLNIQQLIQPVSIGPGIMKTGTDSPSLKPGLEEAKRQGATVIWCHNRFGLEDVPSWLGDRLHALNIHDGGMHHGSYDETYYRYLNIGLKIPFSTGTDWFIDDFARVYVPYDQPQSKPGDVMTPARWLKQLERGRSMITNGPLLEFKLTTEGRSRLLSGDQYQFGGPATVKLKAIGAGRHDFLAIEVVYNGKVVRSAATKNEKGYFSAVLDEDFELTESGWLALRIPDKDQPKHELDRPLFAHTSPIYVEIAGKKHFDLATAEKLVAEMRRALEVIPKRATFASDTEREKVLEVYREGIRTLELRMKSHR